MAILTGNFDGTLVPSDSIVAGFPVDTFLSVTNFGPNPMGLKTVPLGSVVINVGCSKAFYVPKGTSADYDAPGDAGAWQLVVPG